MLRNQNSQLLLSVCVIDYSGMLVPAPHRSMMDPEFVLIQVSFEAIME